MNKYLVLLLLFIASETRSQDCWKAVYEQTLSNSSSPMKIQMDTADKFLIASLDSANFKKIQDLLSFKIVFTNTYAFVNDSIYYDFKLTQQPEWVNMKTGDRSGSYKLSAGRNAKEDSCGGYRFTGRTKMIAGYNVHEMIMVNKDCSKIIWISKELPATLKPFISNVPYAILESIEPENSYVIKEFQNCKMKETH